MLIRKFGWREYNYGWSPPFSIKASNSHNVIFWIRPQNSEKTFLISECSTQQNIFTEYKFIVTNHQKSEVDLTKSKEFTIINNSELIKLVRDFEACNEEYKRHFKLNRILK